MNDIISLPTRQEYSITVENLTLGVLITPYADEGQTEPPVLSTHTHAYCELFVCVEDELVLLAGGREYRLTPGMAALIPAGFPHVSLRPHSAAWSGCGLLIRRRRIRESRNLYGIAARLCCEDVRIFPPAPDIAGVLYHICMYEETDEIEAPLQLFTQLLHLHAMLPESSGPAPLAHSTGQINRIAQLEQLIYTHYSQDITLESAAARLFISKSQLTRMVQARNGTTFHKMILAQRLHAAEKLLVESKLSIEHVGTSVGFSSLSCFYRAFYELHGITPGEYRKRSQ